MPACLLATAEVEGGVCKVLPCDSKTCHMQGLLLESALTTVQQTLFNARFSDGDQALLLVQLTKPNLNPLRAACLQDLRGDFAEQLHTADKLAAASAAAGGLLGSSPRPLQRRAVIASASCVQLTFENVTFDLHVDGLKTAISSSSWSSARNESLTLGTDDLVRHAQVPASLSYSVQPAYWRLDSAKPSEGCYV